MTWLDGRDDSRQSGRCRPCAAAVRVFRAREDRKKRHGILRNVCRTWDVPTARVGSRWLRGGTDLPRASPQWHRPTGGQARLLVLRLYRTPTSSAAGRIQREREVTRACSKVSHRREIDRGLAEDPGLAEMRDTDHERRAGQAYRHHMPHTSAALNGSRVRAVAASLRHWGASEPHPLCARFARGPCQSMALPFMVSTIPERRH